jgi:hypothetical protein
MKRGTSVFCNLQALGIAIGSPYNENCHILWLICAIFAPLVYVG